MTIGGSGAGLGNLVSGNHSDGILINATSTTNVTVQGNLIGTDSSGAIALGNGNAGIAILSGSGITIGGTDPLARNVISGNNFAGVEISASGATIVGDYIGTNVDGAAALGNGNNGVFVNNASNVTIGGSTAGSGNIISGNQHDGIDIDSNSSSAVIEGNRVGTTADGSAAVPNHGFGISVSGASATVGGTGHTVGTCDGVCNLVSGNIGDGIVIAGSGATNATVRGNFVGTDIAGTTAIGNSDGVQVESSASGITIGGGSDSARNLISGNTNEGVLLIGSDAVTVFRNFIGTKANGIGSLGNANDGVGVFATSGATIGSVGSPNRIAFNGAAGVAVNDASGPATGNRIRANSIVSNGGLGIDLGTAGVTSDDNTAPPDQDTGANDLQNFPVLTAATASSGAIDGRLRSTPNNTFTLDFFASPGCDASNHGEGKTFLRSLQVTTDTTGLIQFSTTSSTAFSAGQAVTATATAPDGSTSEFSGCVTAQ